MNTMTNYGAQAIAEDLENLNAPAAKPSGPPTSEARSLAKQGRKRVREEIATDTEMTLTETKPEDFDHGDWKALREAIKSMREKLDAMEEMIDRAETEADEYDEDAGEDRYETYWA